MTQFASIKASLIRWFLKFKFGRFLMRTAIAVIVPKYRIGVNVVCLDIDNNILLLKHVFHPLSPWGLPGGWMDKNESPAECGMRELREETGIIDAIAGETVLISRNPGPEHINIIFMTYVNESRPKTVLDGVEITDSSWVTPETAPKKLTRETVIALKKAWATKNIEFDFPENQLARASF